MPRKRAASDAGARGASVQQKKRAGIVQASQSAGAGGRDSLLQVKKTSYGGRGLFLRTDVTGGTVLLEEDPALIYIDEECKRLTCAYCFRMPSPGSARSLPCECTQCAEVWFCSEKCMKGASEAASSSCYGHGPEECAALRIMRQRKWDKLWVKSSGFLSDSLPASDSCKNRMLTKTMQTDLRRTARACGCC
eukprot:2762964-Rhodomonas_salina.1